MEKYLWIKATTIVMFHGDYITFMREKYSKAMAQKQKEGKWNSTVLLYWWSGESTNLR